MTSRRVIELNVLNTPGLFQQQMLLTSRHTSPEPSSKPIVSMYMGWVSPPIQFGSFDILLTDFQVST